jgi:hypothetical protein
MALIAMCAYCTEENGKLKYLQQTLESLIVTVDLSKHRFFIINNSTYKPSVDFLKEWAENNHCVLFQNEKNLGTAAGINLALTRRNPGEICVKTDDDLTWSVSGWVEQLENMIKKRPEIGILGLKRDDVYGEFVKEGKLLWSHDILGTCTAYNPAMLDKVGYLSQPSQYGFDDCIVSVRSEAAGFKNAFLPHIKITNLDEGGTEYTEWKKREAGVYLQEVSIMMDMIKKSQLDYYYDGGFND